MCRLLLVLLTTATALADPAPKAKTGGLYYPTGEGARLVYEARTGDSVTESSETVEANKDLPEELIRAILEARRG